ncbi:glycosyltransferase [Larkinella soli]|uniref:glycosyltransferase n=1 Tax=Larkinella soli TaxID=1770527 RepID=UPI000FFC0029|nr:glycosyltransferase [Larkinella soli]
MEAPIVLFAYKRPAELEAALRALQENHLSSQSELYVFVDGPKRLEDAYKVEKVHRIVDNVSGFRTVYRFYSETNIGCADSVIRGISYVFERHPAAIIIEDDIVTSPNFLDYMNQCLRQYESNPQVFSVAGYTFPFKRNETYPYDAYFVPRHSPWGWATWRNRWETVDWGMSDYAQFRKDPDQQRGFLRGGSDLVGMLRRQMDGEADAWDIRFCYNRFKHNALTVYPTNSKVRNIGFGSEATHTDIYNRYKTRLDEGYRRSFQLPEEARITDYYHDLTLKRYSIPVRIFNKLKTYAGLR